MFSRIFVVFLFFILITPFTTSDAQLCELCAPHKNDDLVQTVNSDWLDSMTGKCRQNEDLSKCVEEKCNIVANVYCQQSNSCDDHARQIAVAVTMLTAAPGASNSNPYLHAGKQQLCKILEYNSMCFYYLTIMNYVNLHDNASKIPAEAILSPLGQMAAITPHESTKECQNILISSIDYLRNKITMNQFKMVMKSHGEWTDSTACALVSTNNSSVFFFVLVVVLYNVTN